MDNRIDTGRDASCTRSDTVRTTRDDVIDSPMIAFPEADLDAADHPFDAAERVLTAVS